MRALAATTIGRMDANPKDSFAYRFSQALTDAGIADDRQRRGQVAKMFKVSPESVRKWLKGLAIPETSKIQLIAKRLKVNGEWLLTGLGEKSSPAKELQPMMVPPRGTPALSIPHLDVRVSMGHGYSLPDHETVIDHLRLSEEWCRRNLSVSNLANLAALSAYGDSMRPTFDDGDILLVDRGVTELKIDAVYVLQFRDELYVKRIQRRPDGNIVVKSDNGLYDPFVIDPGQNHLSVLGRVVWAWNGRKL